MSDVITAIVSHKSSNNKENVPPPRTPSSSKTPGDCSSSPLRLKAPRVVFAAHNRHHPYSQNLKHLPSSKMSRQPVKSILKQPSHAFLPPPSSPGTPREATPEPEEDALSHARYFASPLAALSASLEDHDGSALIPITQHTLIQAYTKLSTRLRLQFKAGKPSPVMDPLPPALQTLKFHSSALTRAIVRDLSRPLQPPKSKDSDSSSTESDPKSDDSSSSPSSDSSISSSPIPIAELPKKQGVSAEEITFARDTFLLTQAVIRTCAVVIGCHLLHSLFEPAQLSQILESLLDIPLAEKLFLPNARKTTMLSMWALQHQHLPSSVLEGSAVKFVDAMDRAISGKLGKEGKKGAGCEALTAVQMQCSRYPSVFLPHISPLLRTLLEASFTNVNFRLRAPMALGGIALGILKWQQDDPTNEALVEVREDISHTVIKFFKAPVSKGLSPSNALSKAIVEGFAGADNDLDDAPDVTASPQWSLSVLTPIVVMAREELFKSPLAISCVLESLRKGVSSKNKAQVKTATRLFWCSVVWAAAIPSESGNTWDDVGIWKVARQVKASPVNVSIVCSLLYRVGGDDRAERMRKVEMAVNFVGDLVSENQQTGVYILKRLLSSSGVSSRPGSPVKPGRNPVEETDWVPDRLVATSLLDGTILNTEWRSLGPLIKDILNNGDVCAMDDVPPLTIAEIRTPEIFSILISTWEEVVSKIVFQREEEGAVAPLIVFTIWNNLLHSQVGCISDSAIQCIANSLTSFIIPVHQYPKLQDPEDVDKHVVAMTFVKGLWTLTRNILGPFTSSCDKHPLSRIPHALLDSLLDVNDIPVHTNHTLFEIWVDLVGDVLVHSKEERLIRLTQDMVWEDDVSREMWKRLGRIFASAGGAGDVERKDASGDCLALMSVPFSELAEEPVTIRGRETWGCWEMLLDSALEKASGSDTTAEMVLVKAASMLTNCGAPDPQTTLLAASYIISRIQFKPDMTAEEVMATLEPLMFIDRLLLKFGYGDGEEVIDAGFKLFETLQEVISKAAQSEKESTNLEVGIVACALEAVQQGVCNWLDWSNCTASGVSVSQFNGTPMSFYSASLDALRCLPPCMDVLHRLAPLLVCVFDNYPPPGLGVVAFTKWWTEHYAALVLVEDDQYPEIMKPVLRALVTSAEDFIAPGLSYGSEPDSQMVISEEAVVEDSQPRDVKDQEPVVPAPQIAEDASVALDALLIIPQAARVLIEDSHFLTQQLDESSEAFEEEYGLHQEINIPDVAKDHEEFERLYGDEEEVIVPDSQTDSEVEVAAPPVSVTSALDTSLNEAADVGFAQENDDEESGSEVGLLLPQPKEVVVKEEEMESPSALAAEETPSSGDMVEPKTESKDVAPIFADTSIEISVDEGGLVEAANTSLDSVDLTSESDDAIEARMIDDSLEIIPPPSSSPVKRKHGVNDEPSVKKARTAQSSDAVTSPSPVSQDTESSFESLSSRSHSPTGERAESSRLSVHSNFSTPEKSRSISVSDRRTPSNKRQRFFLQCVEVPPMKPIIRRSWSSQGPSTNNNATIVENDVFLASENSPIRNGLAVRGGIQRVKAAASESRIPSTRVPLSLQKSLSVEGSNGRADPFKTPKGVLRRSLSQGSSSLDPPPRPVIDLVMESYGQSGESLEQSEQSDNAIPLGSDDSNAQFFATIMSSDLKARSPVAQGNEINSPTKAHVDRRRQFLRTESMPVTHSSSILSRPPATVRTQSLSSELQLHLQQAVSYKDATRAMEADGLVELSRMLSELSGEVNSALAELALRRSPKEGSSDVLSN